MLGVLASRAARADERSDVICAHARATWWHGWRALVAVDYRYCNNGRGPDQKEWLKMATTGELYRTEGVSTYGAVIRDRFAREARWRGRLAVPRRGPGSVAQPPAAVYLPVDATPWWMGELAPVAGR